MRMALDSYLRLASIVLLALTVIISPALAHHILGIPHYAYDEQYPQTPILTYKQNFGPHEITMTGYPGKPTPGEQCAYNVYITRLDTGEPFIGIVTLTVFQDKMFGTDPIIYGPSDAEIDQAVYKFHPRFDAEANYIARIEFFADDAPWIVDLPVVVGEPGSPWAVAGSVIGGLLLFIIVIRAIRIKLKRRSASTDSSDNTNAATEGAG